MKDLAGNLTETPPQTANVDTQPPVISLPESWGLGRTVNYTVTDPSTGSGQAGSGLSAVRVVISDPNERYPKVHWDEAPSGAAFESIIEWDGRWADRSQAQPGEYLAWVKAADNAGNESFAVGRINVPERPAAGAWPSFPQPSPTASLAPTVLPALPTAVSSAPLQFGGQASIPQSPNPQSSNPPTAAFQSSVPQSPIKNRQSPISNLMWGVTAAAAAGAFLAEALRHKKEREQRLADYYNRPKIEAEGKGGRLTGNQIAKAYQAAKNNFKATLQKAQSLGMSIEQAEQLNDDVAKSGKIGASLSAAKGYIVQKEQEAAERDAAYRAWRVEETTYTPPPPPTPPHPSPADLQAGLQALYEGRKAGEAEAAQQAADLLNDPNLPPADNLAVPLGGSTVSARAPANTQHSKSWWQKTLDWVDHHQPETSIGVGAFVGAIAIGVTLVVVGTVTLPVLAVAAGVAAVAAGVTVAAGTMGLNAHYDRPPTTNIWNNVKAAAITAAAVTGVGLFVAGGLMTQAAIATGNAIAGTCAANPAVCANVGAILDTADNLEEASLAVQLTVETATGNPHAGETAIELQLEQMDGGAPGNTVAAELGEQLAKLGDDVPELIATYGDDIIPLLLKYQDDAVDIIGAYGKDGVVLLRKFGSDTPQAINLIKDFGTPAVRLLDTLDVKSAGKLLRNLDADVLDYTVQQGPDALNALSKWEPEELKEFGVELALRAENDAKALKALDELTKLDINSSDPAIRAEVNRLIQEIADNSTQGSGERFVLGLWDNKNGIAGGYVSDARLNGGEYYASHPDIYNKLEAVYGKGDPRINETLWQINQAALQKQIEKGVDFDYSLALIDKIKDYKVEVGYIKQMVDGNIEDVLDAFTLEGKPLPARLKEVQLLLDAGYTPRYDDAAQVIHWTLEP